MEDTNEPISKPTTQQTQHKQESFTQHKQESQTTKNASHLDFDLGKIIYNANNSEALSTPAVRHMVRKEGLDINLIPATGKNGRVTKTDVINYMS